MYFRYAGGGAEAQLACMNRIEGSAGIVGMAGIAVADCETQPEKLDCYAQRLPVQPPVRHVEDIGVHSCRQHRWWRESVGRQWRDTGHTVANGWRCSLDNTH